MSAHLAAIAGFMLLVTLSGCAGGSDAERGTQRFFTEIGHGVMGHQSSHEEVVIPVPGVVNVEVKSFAGEVVIRGDRSERSGDALVQFDARGTHQGSRGSESEASIPQITWSVELRESVVPGGIPTLVVQANTTHAEPWFQQVDIEILLPELGTVTVETTRGKVQVISNRGPVDITTTKASVRVITAWPQSQPSTILTKDGDIDYRVRGESAFSLDAETVGGLVLARCESGRWVAREARNDHDTLIATLNGGGAPLILRTVDGNIRVAVVGDPHAVGSMIVSP